MSSWPGPRMRRICRTVQTWLPRSDALPMTEAELDFAEVWRAFDHAAASYDAHAVLQREVCDRLPQPTWSRRVLHRLAPSPAEANHLVCADMERLPLSSNSMDLVWSSLAIQWAHDLEATFKGFHQVLAPGGLLIFATFGPDTLKELREAFTAIDDAPHVNRFIDLHDIGDMLIHAGFSSPVMEMEMLTLTYADLKSLMQDLKGIGAHNAALARRRGLLGKTAWSRLEQAYEMQRRDGRLPATFEVIYGHAWAGDKLRREDGRQVIQFNIGERRRKLGLA